MSKLTHVDQHGSLKMVDVSDKRRTLRRARAEAYVRMLPATVEAVRAAELPKGNVLTCAQVAGVMAAKRTDQLIPLCHPLQSSLIDVQLALVEDGVRIESEVKAADATGVEMEALTACSVAALTVYDMCKAIDRGMRVDGLRLLEKTGGKQDYRADESAP